MLKSISFGAIGRFACCFSFLCFAGCSSFMTNEQFNSSYTAKIKTVKVEWRDQKLDLSAIPNVSRQKADERFSAISQVLEQNLHAELGTKLSKQGTEVLGDSWYAQPADAVFSIAPIAGIIECSSLTCQYSLYLSTHLSEDRGGKSIWSAVYKVGSPIGGKYTILDAEDLCQQIVERWRVHGVLPNSRQANTAPSPGI